MAIFKAIGPDERIDQGDLFKGIYFPSIDSDVDAVVITPTCDFERGKAHFVKFIATVSLNFVFKIIADGLQIDEAVFDSGTEISKRQCDNLIRDVKRNSNGDFLPRYYLITEYPGIFPASYLDFQQVFVIPTLQVMEELLQKRIARIDSPWREQIASRYSGYSMRVGTPDYSDDELRSLLTTSGLTLPTT